jgi:GT2 family glycosyltransferase
LINNDLKLDPQWFPSISKAILEHPAPPLACLAGTVLNYDGQLIESQGLRYYWYGRCLNVGNGRPYQPSHINRLAPHLIWGASAAAIVYHRPTLFQIGLFDSDFFAYEEDVDVAFRLQRFNYHTLYLPQAISYHLGGATSSRFGNFRSRHDARNWWFLILKNYSLPQLIVNLPHLLLERSRNLSGLIKSTFISYGFPRFFLYLPSALVFSYGFIFSPNYWLKLSRHRRFLAQLKVQKPLP